MAETYGGWGKTARFFKVKKIVLIRHVLDDLEEVWGEKLNWEDALK